MGLQTDVMKDTVHRRAIHRDHVAHQRAVQHAAPACGDPVVEQVVAQALHHVRRVRQNPNLPEETEIG